MSIVTAPESAQLVLVLQDGVDVKGNPRIKRRKLGPIRAAASSQEVYDTASAIASLQSLSFLRAEQVVQTQIEQG
ncbi:DUF1659 domain-containing protein [Aneurinibacillus sp. Ricciae_BoGa-3]|uniref:DUF1659 domain-containing protein n=1 Tax=Aneurinibacillus sp. Ricciae_BoGa-3 TaxID=3022697 RepID=UPI00234225D2|nr:DUF1659 domain-containing protein [Aneurinibacillus sp. Ricciae_BoGa-3]WCK55904.1 DUF1659 domain-containing protein [Aneurinibacillus sp. Ricciae_BoGa-3]